MKQVNAPKRARSDVDRREFLRRAIGTTVIPGSVVGLVAACTDLESPTDVAPQLGRDGIRGRSGGGYGPVDQDKGELILPRGFQVRSFGRVGTTMSDGHLTPLAHDGMGAFPGPRGRTILVRNHEDRNGPGVAQPIGGMTNVYDPSCGGGTTSLVVGADRMVERDFVSLNGTAVNCAGGPSPWNSWLSCEETAVGPAEGYDKTHGWVFDVPASANGPARPEPILGLGRFSHEAVAVDPRTGIVYETEDNGFSSAGSSTRPGSGFFRYLPEDPSNLHAGGKLQMLKIKGEDNVLLFRGSDGDILVGDAFDVEWVDIDDPALGHTSFDMESRPDLSDGERKAAVFLQGWAKGAAAFERLEGCWFGDGHVFFHDTQAGPANSGHVWQYMPASREGSGGADDCGTLRLIFESPGASVLDQPDNITVSPRGGLVLCEDGGGTQWLRGLTRSGRIFDFAANNVNDTEFAGACFSPDGQTLFVNIQGSTRGTIQDAEDGITLAIWGPWSAGAL